MDELRRLLTIASRRLMCNRILHDSVIALFVSLGILTVWVLISKAIPVLGIPWWGGMAFVGLSVTIAFFVAITRPGRDDVSLAVTIDQKLELDERFATQSK
jgi:hypothetical protein